LYYDDFGSFCHPQKNPFNEWHWILFYHQVTKVHPLPTHPPKKKLPDSSTLAFLQKQKQREKKQAQKK
jgi:hypothetical protein